VQPLDDVNPLADYLGVIRRRWPILILAALVGAASLGFLGRPTGPAHYVATHRLIVNPGRNDTIGYSVNQLAVLASQGDNAREATAELGGTVPCGVSASGNPDLGTLTISAVGSDPDACKRVADTFANVLIDSLSSEDKAALQAQLDGAHQAVANASRALDAAQVAVDQDPKNTRFIAERDAALSRYRVAIENSQTAEQKELPAAPMRSIEPATAGVAAPAGLGGMSVPSRSGLGGALGALAGFAIALGLDALDRRIRTSARAAEAFGVPVVGEVPKHRLAAGDALAPRESSVMEAYRRVRTVVLLSRATAYDAAEENGAVSQRGHVVLVVSPGPKEGKTTTVAHLAASLAESGLRVLAVGGDFRRPRLEKVLGRPDNGDARTPGPWIIGPTDVPNVDIVMARERTREPSRFIRDLGRMLDAARDGYDVIVIDTAPILVANDALELVPNVDDVILVARSRTTTTSAAARASQLLLQVEANLVGAVLTQVSTAETYAYYGYRYGYYGPKKGDDEPVEAESTR
jgi:capsular exopolysaccharide synthesis family protein